MTDPIRDAETIASPYRHVIAPTPEERRKAVEAAQRRLLAKGQPVERVGERWGK